MEPARYGPSGTASEPQIPREAVPAAPAGEQFDDLTPWARDVVLQQRVLATVQSLAPGSWCVDIGGGSGRLVLAGHRTRPDLRWLSLDVVAPVARLASADGRYGIRADGSAMPIRRQCVSWMSYRSSLHYIGLERAMGEAVRVGRPGAKLVVLAKVADQFSNFPEWHLRLHRGRSIVEREVYRSPELLERVAAAGFNIDRSTVFYRWTDYDAESWLSRGNCLPDGQSAVLAGVLRDAPGIQAPDGARIMYEVAGRIYNRIQWALVEASLPPGGSIP